MYNRQSSGIELSTILVYALAEKGHIQYEAEPPRGIGEECVFFSTGGDPVQCFLFKNHSPSSAKRDIHLFFPSSMREIFVLK